MHPRQFDRLPYYARVVLRSDGVELLATAHDLARGGMGVMVGLSDLEDGARGMMAVGAQVTVQLRLPSLETDTTAKARLVWVGQPGRDHQGRRALPLGLMFLPGQDALVREVERFADAFRYVVAVHGSIDMRLLEEALGQQYQIEVFRTAEDLRELKGLLALVVLGDDGRGVDSLSLLQEILNSAALELQPTIVYFAPQRSAALDRGVRATDRVIFQTLPADALQLQTLAQRSIQGHILALENERLNHELAGHVARLTRENNYFRSSATAPHLEGMVGEGATMKRIFEEIERVAAHDVSVLIVGETGTGKTLAAHALHKLSPRANAPFLSQNCAAVAETLLDSELFGHGRGAFTGAVAARAGLFETVNGGTVLLDEVAEMSTGMQAKLLEVLESGTVRRVGESKPLQVDVRVLCATHRELVTMVEEQKFREDLYYRIGTFVIRLPPLRERREEIPLLVTHFFAQATARFGREPIVVSEDAMRLLEGYAWPGNVRQLKQSVDRLAIVCPRDGMLGPEWVVQALQLDKQVGRVGESTSTGVHAGQGLDEALAKFERQLIEKALQQSGGVMAKAAKLLHVERTTLTRRCQRLGIGA